LGFKRWQYADRCCQRNLGIRWRQTWKGAAGNGIPQAFGNLGRHVQRRVWHDHNELLTAIAAREVGAADCAAHPTREISLNMSSPPSWPWTSLMALK
jgi:hypothetical protein